VAWDLDALEAAADAAFERLIFAIEIGYKVQTGVKGKVDWG